MKFEEKIEAVAEKVNNSLETVKNQQESLLLYLQEEEKDDVEKIY